MASLRQFREVEFKWSGVLIAKTLNAAILDVAI